MQLETIKIEAPVTEDNNTGHIVINKSDFNPDVHTEFKESAAPAQAPVVVVSREALVAALAALPGEYTDADYVVNGMRAHYGELFTAEDEAIVRERVKAPVVLPSDGLTVEQIKAALAEKQIEIPAGVTLKADLAALLDTAQ